MDSLNTIENSVKSKTKSSDFWNKLKTGNTKDMGDEFTGPSYSYASQIKTPAELGMSTKPDALGKNVEGIWAYVQMLTNGGGAASRTGGFPLGNRYFLSTGNQCSANIKGPTTGILSSVKKPRSIYINNVPDGQLGFLKDMDFGTSSSMTKSGMSMRGLIPGLLGDMETLNPLHLFSAFTQPAAPPCRKINMSVIGTNGGESALEQYVVDSEIKRIAPCAFANGENLLTGEKCKEGFIEANRRLRGNGKKITHKKRKLSLENKPLANFYTAMVGGVLLYIIYRLADRK